MRLLGSLEGPVEQLEKCPEFLALLSLLFCAGEEEDWLPVTLVTILHFKTKTTNKRSASHPPSHQALPDPPGLGGKAGTWTQGCCTAPWLLGESLGVPWVTPQRTNGTG